MCSYTMHKTRRMQVVASSAPNLVLIWCTTLALLLQSGHSDPQVPCYFVFGDSLFDNGNNNNLPTSAKVNYPPYGIDYPGQQPTGRFSNGRSIVDFISGHLGFNGSIPPFSSAATMDAELLLKGVNYASGAAGIRLETGQHMGGRIPLDLQLVNHEIVRLRILDLIRENPSYLERCLYMINVGSNDYLNNYYMPAENYSTSLLYTPLQYSRVLVQQYSMQIQRLYLMGARKVALFAVGELGCTPQAINKYGLGIFCAHEINVATELFNVQLRRIIDNLNSKLTGANFTCINMNVLIPTSIIGFLHLKVPCCKVKSNGQCEEDTTPCAKRDHYVFFDNFHPTEAANRRLASRAYRAISPIDVYPIDIRTLVRI